MEHPGVAPPWSRDEVLVRYLRARQNAGAGAEAIELDGRRLLLLVQWLEPVRPLEANRAGIESFLAAQGLSEGSRARYMTTVRAFYQWAVAERLVAMDPTVGLVSNS
jgi:site-specific recombinase XerD